MRSPFAFISSVSFLCLYLLTPYRYCYSFINFDFCWLDLYKRTWTDIKWYQQILKQNSERLFEVIHMSNIQISRYLKSSLLCSSSQNTLPGYSKFQQKNGLMKLGWSSNIEVIDSTILWQNAYLKKNQQLPHNSLLYRKTHNTTNLNANLNFSIERRKLKVIWDFSLQFIEKIFFSSTASDSIKALGNTITQISHIELALE